MEPTVYDATYAAVDFETTGLTTESEPVEIGVVRFSLQGPQTQKWQSFIRPSSRIPRDAIAIHGITDEMVQRAPDLDEVMDVFYHFTNGDVVVGHNVSFDLRYVTEEYFPEQVVDTLKLARENLDSKSGYSLGVLEDSSVWHRALPDALATMRVFRRCVEKLEVQGGEPPLLADILRNG